MNDKGTISLVIPTRNRPNHLNRMLTSLEQCDYFKQADIEVIVVDNAPYGSQTRQVCELFPVRYLLEKRSGRSAALNLGIENARGEYIAFTDDDIVIKDKDWLYRLKNNFCSENKVGYVSGNVVAYELNSRAQWMWENKGGLSKGNLRREFNQEFFTRKRLTGVPIRLIAAGANSMIPKEILNKINGYDISLGPGNLVCHGESLDICYKVLRLGYSAVYDPNIVNYHYHPRSLWSLRKKMLRYGIGDTAVHCKFLFEYKDIRGLFEVLWGRPGLLFVRLLRSLIGVYPMSPDMLVFGLIGAVWGPFAYALDRILNLINWTNGSE